MEVSRGVLLVVDDFRRDVHLTYAFPFETELN